MSPHQAVSRVGEPMGQAGDRGTGEREVRVLVVMSGALAKLVAMTVGQSRHATREAVDGTSVRQLLADWHPHLALVDIDEFDPIVEVVHGAGDMPLIALTRRRDTAVKVRAFERGVDDVIEIPFTLDEIVVRPHALLRRAHGIDGAIIPKVRLGDCLEVDLLESAVQLDGSAPLILTPIQQALLYILAANAGETLTRESLLASIWGDAFQIESNVIDRHIRELRVKLGDDWRTPRYIETVPGRGYRFARELVPGRAASASVVVP
jgi:DNA-binding response OmpR family regulator